MNPETRLEPVLEAAVAAASEVDASGAFPEAAVAALRTSGLLGLTLPEKDGGLGGGPEELVTALSSIAAVCGSTAMVYLMHVSAAMAISAAPPQGRSGLLERLASGTLATLALSEPGSRSHFWAPVSQAAPADGGVHLKTDKSWVTSAGHAGLYVVSTLSPSAEDASDLYVVDAGADGVSVAGPWRGLGLRGNASSPMTFDMFVPDGDRLGAPGDGLNLKMGTVLPWFTLGNAAVSLGLGQAAVDAAVGHASRSRFQHTGDRLADLPTIRAQLARCSLDLETTRSYVEAAARSLASPENTDMLRVLGVKAAANDAALRITDTAMRVCGGAAFSQHLQLERFFRDARAGHVMAPTADVLYDFYGKALTGLPLF